MAPQAHPTIEWRNDCSNFTLQRGPFRFDFSIEDDDLGQAEYGEDGVTIVGLVCTVRYVTGTSEDDAYVLQLPGDSLWAIGLVDDPIISGAVQCQPQNEAYLAEVATDMVNEIMEGLTHTINAEITDAQTRLAHLFKAHADAREITKG